MAHGILRLEDWHQFALCLTLESATDPATAPWRLLDVQFLLPRVGGRVGVMMWMLIGFIIGSELMVSPVSYYIKTQLPVDAAVGGRVQQAGGQPPQQLYHPLEPDARQRQRVFELLMGILVRF